MFGVAPTPLTCSASPSSPESAMRPGANMPAAPSMDVALSRTSRRSGIGIGKSRYVARAQLRPHQDEPRGVRVGQRPQQDAVDDAENRGAGADAQGNGEGGDGGESRTLAQSSRGVRDVLDECVHVLPRVATASGTFRARCFDAGGAPSRTFRFHTVTGPGTPRCRRGRGDGGWGRRSVGGGDGGWGRRLGWGRRSGAEVGAEVERRQS